MVRKTIPLSTQYNKRGDNANDALVNLYAVPAPQGRTGFDILGISGLIALNNLGALPGRGAIAMAGLAYVVSGTQAYQVHSNGAAIPLGNIPGNGKVRLAHNGTQIACVNSLGDCHIITASGVTKVTDTDYLPASDVVWVDGYMVFTRKDSGEFFYSAVQNPTEFDSLDFATAEGAPDNNVGLIVDKREILIAGTETIEVWQNTGAPFSRVGGAFIQRGVKARGSLKKLDNSVFFLGDDLAVYRLNGYTPVEISTDVISGLIERAAVPENAIGDAWRENGQLFYSITFDNFTGIYNLRTGRWSTARSNGLKNWRRQHVIHVFNQNLCLDAKNGKIYVMDTDAYTEDAEPLVATMDFPYIHAEGRKVIVSEFRMMMETGVGNSGESDPAAMVSVSKDGGRTFGTERQAVIGQIGQYRRRVRAFRFGQMESGMFRVSISDPVKRQFWGAVLEADIGD